MIKAFLSVFVLTFLLAGCSQGNVSEDNSLKQYFDAEGVNGSFGMFDNFQGHFSIYNLPRFRDSSYLPAATFDIVQSLVSVQTGVVKDDSTVILRDSANKADTLCGGNLTLGRAFRYSCTAAFRELSRRIGRDTLKKWIDSLGYGNKDISSAVDTFWLDNHLTITSDEELGLAKKLYFDQLPFFPRSQKIVRRMMLMENNSNYRLSYKSGSGIRKDGHAFTWFVGWIEENKDPYFFVLNLDAAEGGKNLTTSGLTVLKNILKQEGFFLGKK